MKLDVAVVSVITSGIVAVAGLLFPLLMNFILDSRKWSREKKAAEAEKVDKASVTLLETLSIYRTRDAFMAAGRPEKAIHSDILSRYYAWERAISSHFRKTDFERIKQLRAKFENGDYQTFYDDEPALAGEILDLTHSAIEKIK